MAQLLILILVLLFPKETLLAEDTPVLPQGFVYLEEVDPSIITQLRYFSQDNFVGRRIKGYKAPRTILTKEAALALKKAQALFKKQGYSLIVYDAYRPQQAVDDFMAWSKDSTDQKMKALFYPYVDKAKVFELNYVAEKSGHSRGSTVDVSLIPLGAQTHEIQPGKRTLEDGREILFLDDGTLDMGTSFDLFDVASHYENEVISPEYQERRTYLKTTMEKAGFKNYPEEWWHFTLEQEPFPQTYFNFPVA